jgi:hypothetical protein
MIIPQEEILQAKRFTLRNDPPFRNTRDKIK